MLPLEGSPVLPVGDSTLLLLGKDPLSSPPVLSVLVLRGSAPTSPLLLLLLLPLLLTLLKED